jgi:hypothetical protein
MTPEERSRRDGRYAKIFTIISLVCLLGVVVIQIWKWIA